MIRSQKLMDMGSSSTHPASIDGSIDSSLSDRLSTVCYRIALLGGIGFLSLFDGYIELLEYAALFYLLFLAIVIPLFLDGAEYVMNLFERGRSRTADEVAEPHSWIENGYRLGPVKSILSFLVLLQPIVLFQIVLQWIGYAVILLRYNGALPEPDQHENTVEYRLPFEGEWAVINGSPDRRYSHSWSIPQQRYAYDFVKTDEGGNTYNGESGPNAHYCFDEPILAPADGTVVAVRNSHRDYHRTSGWLDPLQYNIRGNYIVIKHDGGEYSLLAHLKNGSVTVSPGDVVETGDAIGRCGHSGNSTEPHLHFQIQDSRFFFVAMSLPVVFSSVRSNCHGEEPIHSERTFVHRGQKVSSSR